MPEKPTPEEIAIWQKRLASQANNRAWALADQFARTADEDDEMLQGAHAALFLWNIIGSDGNKAHAAQLVAHVYGLLKSPTQAKQYLGKSQPFFLERECAPWELAFAHAVAANVSAASGEHESHLSHYQKAKEIIAALVDPEDRTILLKTMAVIPTPFSSGVA